MTIFRKEVTSALAGFQAVPFSWLNWNLEMLVFRWSKENQGTRRKTFGTKREPTTNSTYIKTQAIIQARAHWWQASAFITAPPLFQDNINYFCEKLHDYTYSDNEVLVLGPWACSSPLWCWSLIARTYKNITKIKLAHVKNWHILTCSNKEMVCTGKKD